MKLQLTFVESVEDGQVITFKSNKAMDEKLKRLAELHGISKSSVIRRFIDYGFKTLDIQNSKK
jgi:hypothetical protein